MKKMLSVVIVLIGVFAWTASYARYNPDNDIEAYEPRYAAFLKKNPGMEGRDVLIMVNLGLDQPNYQHAVEVAWPERVDVFVSKHYALPQGYKPKNLVKVDRNCAQSGVTLREDCYNAFLSMAKDMEKKGLQLYIKAGYRLNKKRGSANSLWYAWPGHSEHQTGLAFDLRKKNVTYKTLGEYDYEKTREYAWLMQHAYRYGFILSYPKGKSELTGFGFEPWHWRYIGVEIATDMKEKGFVTYHEYWATYLIRDALAIEKPTFYPRRVGRSL